MSRMMKESFPGAEEMRMISSRNSRQMNSYTGFSRNRTYRRAGMEDRQETAGHFGIRLLLALLLFAGFCFMEREDRTIGLYDSTKIKEVIQQDMDLQTYIDRLEENGVLAVFAPSGL